MIRSILKVYSAIFRYGGLVMAIMSLVVSVAMGDDIARHGYVLVAGRRLNSISAMVTAVGVPLLGVGLGLALFLLVPKIDRTSDRSL